MTPNQTAGPFDIACILYDEKLDMFLAVTCMELEADNEMLISYDPSRPIVTVYASWTTSQISASFEYAVNQLSNQADKHRIRKENILRDVVFPVRLTGVQNLIWKIPNWQHPKRQFSEVFPGRPVPRNAWKQLLSNDLDGLE